MNSAQIRVCDEFARTDRGWLKEIAYQLALLNEMLDQQPESADKLTPKKRK